MAHSIGRLHYPFHSVKDTSSCGPGCSFTSRISKHLARGYSANSHFEGILLLVPMFPRIIIHEMSRPCHLILVLWDQAVRLFLRELFQFVLNPHSLLRPLWLIPNWDRHIGGWKWLCGSYRREPLQW